MAEHKGFFLYLDQYPPIAEMTLEQKGILLEAMFTFNSGIEPEFADPFVKLAFAFFRQTFERDRERYENKCEQMRQNAKKKTDTSKCNQKLANVIKSIQQQEQEQYQEQNKEKKEKSKSARAHPPKPEKFTFGEFQNVRLTQAEYDKLCASHPDMVAEGIELLSAQLEAKGDKYKSHYATFRTWVWDAVRERRSREAGKTRASPGNGFNAAPSSVTEANMKTVREVLEARKRQAEAGYAAQRG